MKTVIVALIDRVCKAASLPQVRFIGMAVVYLSAGAVLTYIVLQLREQSQYQEERQRNAAMVIEALKEAQAERDTFKQRLSELEWTVWGDIQPHIAEEKVKSAEAAEARRVIIPVWRNREQEILDRLRVLEQWRLRHMSEEH